MSLNISVPQIRAKAEIERRARMTIGGVNIASLFVQEYFDHPAKFAAECLVWPKGESHTAYQIEISDALPEKKRVCVRAPHGVGKTAMAAITVIWFALTRDAQGEDWKIPTTASSWRQLTKYLWPEIHKWLRRVRWDKVGRSALKENYELLDQSIKLKNGEAFALASDQPALLEGAHAKNLLYILDEAKTIPDETWDAVEGAFSVGECMALAFSTPGEPSGRFYEIQKRAKGFEDWWTRYITLDEAVKSGRVSAKWARQRERQWGTDSAAYQNRVLGNFASNDEDGIIPLAAIERANARWQAMADAAEKKGDDEVWGDLLGIGADIGRGGDPTVLANLYKNNTIRSLDHSRSKNLMEVTGILRGRLQRHLEARSVIDLIGIGAGVFDNLREDDDLAERVIPFNAGSATDLKDASGELGFVDLRSAAWWNAREMLLDPSVQVALPPDDKLTGDLTAPRSKIQSGGKIKVESKDDIRKRIGRSTDDGDAVIMILMLAKLQYSLPWDTIG